ncbi:flagellar hook-length control protein FliK [Pseudomonas sp. PDNC002]|uniref:flagellar hook-length control protein FliK n=1 Tax=Pseudomonas sp. PDNC002 TaxID=2811422 RepID=UPI001964E758|nr:flagellar hook-length control protein FliK [Pseudomonas sp. PDNC002]QRY80761.1 flagellar hook-length control protein FliK [Pseudomonas sp. PDNC002]
MIQLPTQSPPTTDRDARPVAEARPPVSTRDDSRVAGFRAQQPTQSNAGERAISVQSFLTQFDTAQVEQTTQPPTVAQPGLPEALPAEDTDADMSAQRVDDASPSGAESWLAGMLSQAGLVVQARDNPPARTSAQVPGFATQSVDPSVQSAPAAVKPEDMLLPPAEPQDEAGKVAAPAPREATQSQAQTLLQQHLTATSVAPESPAPSLPGAAPVTSLPAGDNNAPATVSAAATPLFDKPLHLKGNTEAHWGEQMLTALRDNVELQLTQRVQNATIRLDPPELGAMEILVRHEAGQLNVQISASNGDVVRLLQNTSERLRQELVGQNFLQVNVQVSPDAQSGQQGQQNRQRFADEQVAVAANPRDAQAGERSAPRGDSDVLITV